MLTTLARSLRGFMDLESSSLNEAMRLAAPLARGRLIDVGCGDKPYEQLFRPHVTEYVGVEYEGTFSGSENEKRGRADVLYDGRTLPFEDASFDTVLCNQVLEHVPEPAEFFGELVRVLRPGGRLVLTVPFSFREHSIPHDFHRFTRYALDRYANQAALDVEVLNSRGGMWSVIGQKVASHLTLDILQMGGEVQRAGALTYEAEIKARPRYWAVPVLAPAVAAVVAAARMLDRIDHDNRDTLGWLLVARKRG